MLPFFSCSNLQQFQVIFCSKCCMWPTIHPFFGILGRGIAMTWSQYIYKVFTIHWLNGINKKSSQWMQISKSRGFDAFQPNLHKRALEPQAAKVTNTWGLKLIAWLCRPKKETFHPSRILYHTSIHNSRPSTTNRHSAALPKRTLSYRLMYPNPFFLLSIVNFLGTEVMMGGFKKPFKMRVCEAVKW